MKARVIFTCAFLFSFEIMRTKIKTIFVLLVLATLLGFRNKPKRPTLYGTWEFQYLLINDTIKDWVLNYTASPDYMGLTLYGKSEFMVGNSCFAMLGKYKISNDNIVFDRDTSTILLSELAEHNSTFGINKDNIIDFYLGSRKFELINDSILKIYKTKDSAFVFLKL